MEIGYLNEVKAILKSLVVSHPGSITVDKLNRDYRDVEGEYIPFRRLGYNNLEQFLKQIPDTLVVVGSGYSASVYFVGNEKCAHIHNMIMAQRKPRPRAKNRVSHRSNIGFSARPPRPVDRGRHNSYFAAAKQTRKVSDQQMPGQRLSAFEKTNRNVSTRTVTVRDVSQQNKQQTNAYVGKVPTVHTNTSIPNPLPLPNGIDLCPLDNAKTTTNAIKQKPIEQNQTDSMKTVNDKNNSPKMMEKFQEHVKQLEGLMATSCYVRPPRVKTVSFSPETSTPTNNPFITHTLAGINQPKPKVKLSEDVEKLLRLPTSFAKKSNPVEVCEDVVQVPKVTTKQNENTECDKNEVRNFKKLLDISDVESVVNDIDEAVPQFAANHRVFRLDFPKHTVPYGSKIDRYKIPDNLHVGTQLGIFVAEIHNPFRFWFHIHKEEHELDILMHKMERFYSTRDAHELRMPLACINPGQVCAASFNDMWHRAEIVAPPVKNKVKVCFVDYGTVSEVDLSEIKFLDSYFAKLPTQALRGCLSHIKPRGQHWSHEATTYFLSCVSELMLFAKITEIDRENLTFYMILCDTHGKEDVQINKSLVEENYALYNEDWQEFKIKKNNDRRIRHPREDFPTFSMIESGEYPSFAELVHLKQNRIDYEIIYDRIIFNKFAILNTHDNVPETIRKLPFFLLNTNPFRTDIILELTGNKTSTC